MSILALAGVAAAMLIASPAAAQIVGDPKRDVLMWYEAFGEDKPELLDQLLAPTWVNPADARQLRSGPDRPPRGLSAALRRTVIRARIELRRKPEALRA